MQIRNFKTWLKKVHSHPCSRCTININGNVQVCETMLPLPDPCLRRDKGSRTVLVLGFSQPSFLNKEIKWMTWHFILEESIFQTTACDKDETLVITLVLIETKAAFVEMGSFSTQNLQWQGTLWKSDNWVTVSRNKNNTGQYTGHCY